MREQTEKLASAQLFSGLEVDQLAELLLISRVAEFKRDAVIVRDGEPGSEMFVVMGGRVRISLRLSGAEEEALGFLGPGGTFGEMAVFTDQDPGARSATAVAHEDCSLLVIDGTELRALLDENRDLGFVVLSNLVSKLSAALRTSNDKVTLLSESARF
ncbi:MAG: cyclic nucleotide-binding domain-containing protein [bacterium]|nr:cyclic nucleotide-binding domain-containing protein [bacterium]